MEAQVPCPHCGKLIAANSSACPYCGFRPGLDGPATEPTAHYPAYAPPAPAARRKTNVVISCVIAAAACLVLVPIFGMCVAVGLPNFSKVNVKAREAEVKQNVHAIQLALERFYTDEGHYPAYLYGGDSRLNIGTVNYYNPAGRTAAAYWQQPLRIPYDRFAVAGADWDYGDAGWQALAGDDPQTAYGDPVQYEGYMPSYPANPFMVRSQSRRFSLAALDNPLDSAYACYGGRDGDRMFNLGPFGELPQLKLEADGSSDERLDFPGSFYYHPRWKDQATNTGHLRAAQADNPGSWIPADAKSMFAGLLDDSAQATGKEVGGYDLIGFGASQTRGQDLDNSVGADGTANFFCTGYLTLAQERNPWVGPNAPEGDYGGQCGDFDERPYSDSIPDFFIIHLGSGM